MDLAKMLLIEHGVDVNAISPDDVGTPLHTAIKNGHVELAKLLLDHGANRNAVDREGSTPIFLAANSGEERWGWLKEIDEVQALHDEL
jgi:ankyrin repeat protein